MKRSILKVVVTTSLITSIGMSDELVLSGSKVEFAKKLSFHQLHNSSVEQGDISILIHTKKGLSSEQKDTLYQLGVKSLGYAGINSYYLNASKDKIEDIVNNTSFITKFAFLKPEYKINSDLKDVNINDKVKIKLSLLKSISQDDLSALLRKNDIFFQNLRVDVSFLTAEMDVYGIDIQKIASLSVVKEVRKHHDVGIVEPLSQDVSNFDLDTAKKTNADDVWQNNTGLDGLNIPVAVVDEGEILKTHKEFKIGSTSRVKDMVKNASLSLHSTHVAGIIGAKGVDSDAKGMAESTQIFNFSYQDEYFADSIATLASSYNILVSNHSYGFTDKVDLGVYNIDASNEDSLVYNNPYINVFMAAGNDRVDDDYPKIGIIKGAANAKNVFTIGALDYNSNDVAYYSSTGPVNDFRIKPDLCVKGSSVYSTSSSGGYAYMTGTSMATPAATGLATLVMQEYKNITDCGNGVGCDMRHDLLKAVLINTAVDKNNPGPDIYTGYGMIDIKEAVNAVKTIQDKNKKVKIDKINKGDIKEYNFTKYTNGKFDVTVSWVDPAGNSASNGKTLVNDIDIYLVNIDNNKKYYPYSLDKDDVTAYARKDRKNDVDNTEKIEVSNLPVGDYKLVVDASGIQTSQQEFAIASSEAVFDVFSSSIDLRETLEVNNFAKVMLESIY